MLNKYRTEINKIDKSILDILEQRIQVSKKIGLLKKERDLKIYDSERETILINDLINLGLKKDLDKDYIKDIFKIILDESKRIQKIDLKN
jgi:chorismate mutase